jgi:hypothetical protein
VEEEGEKAISRFIEGYQYADGSFVAGESPCIRITTSSPSLFLKLAQTAELFNVPHSKSRDHPKVGFSLRISAEGDMREWIRHVPLLNPVQITKFLVWDRFSECPPRLFFSQYVGLLSGRIELRRFSRRLPTEAVRSDLFQDSVDLVTRFVLAGRSLALAEIAKETVARTVRGAGSSIGRLVKEGFARLELRDGKMFASLTPAGEESVSELRDVWQALHHFNTGLSSLKSYELATAR